MCFGNTGRCPTLISGRPSAKAVCGEFFEEGTTGRTPFPRGARARSPLSRGTVIFLAAVSIRGRERAKARFAVFLTALQACLIGPGCSRGGAPCFDLQGLQPWNNVQRDFFLCAGATFAERSVKRVRAAGTPFPRRFAKQSLRARSPLSRGDSFCCSEAFLRGAVWFLRLF